jgi:ABC-type sugar transport system ATPase subunit
MARAVALAGASSDGDRRALARVFTRPEDVEISANGGQGANQLAGIIEQVAYLGDRFEYHVKAAGVSLVLLASKKQRFNAGEAIQLGLDPARLNVRSV